MAEASGWDRNDLERMVGVLVISSLHFHLVVFSCVTQPSLVGSGGLLCLS